MEVKPKRKEKKMPRKAKLDPSYDAALIHGATFVTFVAFLYLVVMVWRSFK